MRTRRTRVAAIFVALVALTTGHAVALARPDASYWSLAMAGGYALPRGEMATKEKPTLAVGARLGYTGASGLGLALSGRYAPLPERAVLAGAVTDNQLVELGLGPRFTLGRGAARLWLGGTGGALSLRTSTRLDDGRTSSASAIELAASGEAGLALMLFDAGGIELEGDYLRSFGSIGAELVTLTGGLVFTF